MTTDFSDCPNEIIKIAEDDGLDLKVAAGKLRPRLGLVYRDIAIGFAGLLLGLVVAWSLSETNLPLTAVGITLGAIIIGAFFAYLQLFVHEAAHYNIASERKANDRLANLLLTVWLGQTITEYRKVHFAHHKHLGTPDDPERSYQYRPDYKLLLESLFLVHLFRVFFTYTGRSTSGSPSTLRKLRRVAIGMTAHLFVLLAALILLGWASVFAWLIGVASVFPVFATWRQLLEHRRPDADPAVDYTRSRHGGYTRMFGTRILERLIGGAGFNRHLLHHWFPPVSYTRFDDLERMLASSPRIAELLNLRQDSYPGAFATLWKGAHPRSRAA